MFQHSSPHPALRATLSRRERDSRKTGFHIRESAGSPMGLGLAPIRYSQFGRLCREISQGLSERRECHPWSKMFIPSLHPEGVQGFPRTAPRCLEFGYFHVWETGEFGPSPFGLTIGRT